jgi:hypothetical protein
LVILKMRESKISKEKSSSNLQNDRAAFPEDAQISEEG